MGKKKAKSKQGKQTPRKVPQPRVPDKAPDPFEETDAVCCNCNQSFYVKDLQGDYPTRVCPHCHSILSEEAFDQRAQIIMEPVKHFRQLTSALFREETQLKQAISGCIHWWQTPYRFLLQKKLDKLTPKLKQAQKQKSRYDQQMFNLSLGRYYVSEWFLSTHIQLTSKMGDPREHYQITPRYNTENYQFTLVNRDKSSNATGIIAEFKAFELFRKACQNANSALHQARLTPNLYVPIQSQNTFFSPFWSQIDLAVLTKQCAFIVEVKSRNASIVVEDDLETIYLSKYQRNNEFSAPVLFNYALEQNEGHAMHFAQNCFTYPKERIYKVIVFVEPQAFTSCNRTFVDNVFVGCIPQQASTLMSACETACKELEDLITQEELDALAQSLINQYGDLNQQRHQLHVNRLHNLQEIKQDGHRYYKTQFRNKHLAAS